MAIKKILLIGPIAPPYGGVSIHLQRLVQLLKYQFEFDYIDESKVIKHEYLNIRSLNFIKYLRKVKNADILYINSGKRVLRVFHILTGKLFLKKIILNIHSCKEDTPKLILFINGTIYRLTYRIVVVNSQIKKLLKLPDKKCKVLEAFIPPFLEGEPALPKYVQGIICSSKTKNRILISANASSLKTYNNEDLYGLDLCIEVTRRLVNKEINIIFIFVVGSTLDSRKMFTESEERIMDLNLNNNFFLLNDNLSFVKLIEQSDIILRPTNTDGDSITIREALFLNKKVLASDVVPRPTGTNLFKNRNIEDLESTLENLIKSKLSIEKTQSASPGIKIRELKEEYISLFSETSNFFSYS